MRTRFSSTRARPAAPPPLRRRDGDHTASSIWSPMVKAGLSDVMGSWKIIAMRSPRRSASRSAARRAGPPPRRRSAAHHARGGLGQQPHDRQRNQRLAAADSPTRQSVRPGRSGQADAVDEAEPIRQGREADGQVLDGEKRRQFRRAGVQGLLSSVRQVRPEHALSSHKSWRIRKPRRPAAGIAGRPARSAFHGGGKSARTPDGDEARKREIGRTWMEPSASRGATGSATSRSTGPTRATR